MCLRALASSCLKESASGAGSRAISAAPPASAQYAFSNSLTAVTLIPSCMSSLFTACRPRPSTARCAPGRFGAACCATFRQVAVKPQLMRTCNADSFLNAV